MGILAAQLSNKSFSNSDFKLLSEKVMGRILSVCSPEKIYIFGSYGRLTPNESSDLDIAIIFSTNEQVKQNKKLILKSKLFLDYSVDILFYSIDEFIQKSKTGGVCAVIDREGRLIYDKRTKV